MGAAEGCLGVCMGRIPLHTENGGRANIEGRAYLGREDVSVSCSLGFDTSMMANESTSSLHCTAKDVIMRLRIKLTWYSKDELRVACRWCCYH